MIIVHGVYTQLCGHARIAAVKFCASAVAARLVVWQGRHVHLDTDCMQPDDNGVQTTMTLVPVFPVGILNSTMTTG